MEVSFPRYKPGRSLPIWSAMLPFLTFSTTAPIRPPGNSFPPMTLSPRMVADEEDADAEPASNGKFASLKFF